MQSSTDQCKSVPTQITDWNLWTDFVNEYAGMLKMFVGVVNLF